MWVSVTAFIMWMVMFIYNVFFCSPAAVYSFVI